jgi:hypothetical protein
MKMLVIPDKTYRVWDKDTLVMLINPSNLLIDEHQCSAALSRSLGRARQLGSHASCSCLDLCGRDNRQCIRAMSIS